MTMHAFRLQAGVAALVLGAAAARALDSSDLLFHLSFDDGVTPEFARGGRVPAELPQEAPRRMAPGLIGNGYLFAGKGSTVQYFSGEKEPRACDEMYGPKWNLHGEAGTVAFWMKPLSNTHNQTHIFFRADTPGLVQILRNEYQHHWFSYQAKTGCVYDDASYLLNPWIHFALAWRKDEVRAYFNGIPMGVVDDCGVMSATPERFSVACAGVSSSSFQPLEAADDSVMDEFQIFNRPLAEEEVRALFERGHVTTRQASADPALSVTAPSRAWIGHTLSAPSPQAAVTVDGDLGDWSGIPEHGGFIERRVGVLDDDPGRICVAADQDKLYLGFRCPVDESIQRDRTHVWYPTGEFKVNPRERDGDVRADDYVEFALRGKEGREYRFAANAQGAMLDARDGDTSWNADVECVGRSDEQGWTLELAIPLAAVDLSHRDTVDFNVVRSWKLFKSSQNSLCADERSQPSWGKLNLGSSAAAAVDSLGEPWKGRLAVAGSIVGPAGDYTVILHGRGFGQEFRQDLKVRVDVGLTRFAVERTLEKTGDIGLAVEVLDPAGRGILARSVPFVFVTPSRTEIADFPTAGRLDVTVTPVRREKVRAAACLLQGERALQQQEIVRFDDPARTVSFDTRELSVGDYQVLTQLYQADRLIGTDRQPYSKKPPPEWLTARAGVIDGPPVPWTDVEVRGRRVKLLLKEIVFAKTLFPAQIISNGQDLLSGPVRIRLWRNGAERVLTAGDFAFAKNTRRRADWVSTARDGDLQIEVSGWIEFDGFTWMDLALSGGKLDRLSLEIPLRRECATLKTLEASGRLGDQPLTASGCGYWFGNEKAGLQYWWEDQRGWVLNGERVAVTPGPSEVVISIPFIQQAVDLQNPRTVTFGWAVTPAKPLPENWRHIKLRRGICYSRADYTWATPNYARPRESEEWYRNAAEALKKPDGPLVLWYAFGPFMWRGAPEYADWWREWRYTPSELARPDPRSTAWGPACHHSTASDLQTYLLAEFVKKHPQKGVYIDCMVQPECDNAAHGCGYTDERGIRRPSYPLLAARRHYERIYNVIKANDPRDGWVRHHDWGPNMAVAAFCDENWYGEGLIAPVGATPEKNYYRVISLPYARVQLHGEHWGFLPNFLTELAVSAGMDKEKRAEWFGKMIAPPTDGRHGTWVVPRWKDYEHVAGLSLAHDMWQVGGNDVQWPAMLLDEMQRRLGWDDAVRFVGYWELGDRLAVEGGAPEQAVCSLYYRPAVTEANGNRSKPWLLLAPMNNSDEDVILSLRPSLATFGLRSLDNGQLRDVYRGLDYVFDGPATVAAEAGGGAAWRANEGDPEAPHIVIRGVEEVFPMDHGLARVPVPRRNFRALLLQPRERR